MITIDRHRTPADLLPHIDRLFEVSAGKLEALDGRWAQSSGAPVSPVGGKTQARGWTDWTQGFQPGSPLLRFDAPGAGPPLETGGARPPAFMPPHLPHRGVHE